MVLSWVVENMDTYVAFLFVSLSYGVGHCCHIFFSYRLSSADAFGTKLETPVL